MGIHRTSFNGKHSKRWKTDEAFRDFVKSGCYEQAVGLYQGPFLEDVQWKTDEFEDWCARVNVQVKKQLRKALEALYTDAEKSGDHKKAVEWADRPQV